MNEQNDNTQSEKICLELLILADRRLSEIENHLPKNPDKSTGLLIQMLRTRDFWEISKSLYGLDGGPSIQELDVMRMGMNLATALLLKPLSHQGFPLQECTLELRNSASSILYHLGCTTMIKRVVAMVRAGFLTVAKEGLTFTFNVTSHVNKQFLDEMEFSYIDQLEHDISEIQDNWYLGWQLIDVDNPELVKNKPGFFLGIRMGDKAKVSKWILKDIDERMRPLVKLLETGRGDMISYGSTQEIEEHFLAIAMDMLHAWRNEAGFHPDIKLGELSGVELTLLITHLTALHLKHIHFTALASEKFKSLNIPQTLTIWESFEDLIASVSSATRISPEKIRLALNAIMLSPHDATILRDNSSRFTPMLINLENGYVLRVASGALRNPFYTLIALIEYRDPNARLKISECREPWVRRDLYAIFSGTRYQCVEGNINLRSGNNITTDIDACVYDNLTGELALFQIKWQDFFYNDVKKLRSKASNLVREMDEWAEKVSNWITEHGKLKLGRSLKLKNKKEGQISAVYLFGISRNAARMEGYGYTIKSKNLAITNWPMLIRHRAQMPPSKKVLSSIHNAIIVEPQQKILGKAMPFELRIGNVILTFNDLWTEFSKKDDEISN